MRYRASVEECSLCKGLVCHTDKNISGYNEQHGVYYVYLLTTVGFFVKLLI